jgi:hypothetical protein
MKTMHSGKYFLSIAIMAFLLFSAANSFGARKETSRNCDLGTGATHVGGAGCQAANNRLVVSPYWQVDAGSYTFIAISHTSLSGMASAIGVRVNAITSTGSAYDTAESFTITAGSTERVFIVPTGHATVNATSITTAKFLAGTSGFTHGSIRVEPVTSHPMLLNPIKFNHSGGFDGRGFRDITMLSYWGSVIIEANTTGFAMEFMGDMNDSIAMHQNTHHWIGTNNCDGQEGTAIDSTKTAKVPYRNCGLNTPGDRQLFQTGSSGPNLQ